ncbi:MAG TPA: hypothetical protein VGK04_01680 [Thermoanaerobaculia bacterium]
MAYRASSRIALAMAVALAVFTFAGISLCATPSIFLTGRTRGLAHIFELAKLLVLEDLPGFGEHHPRSLST